MKRCIRFKDTIVTSCDTCPRNVELKNKIWGILPPTHHCKDTFDGHSMDGRVIFMRNIIPDWCPYEIENMDLLTFNPAV